MNRITSHLGILVAALLSLALVASSCQPKSAPTPEAPANTRTSPEVVSPPPASTPTPTPQPPSTTPPPIPQPVPTPTPPPPPPPPPPKQKLAFASGRNGSSEIFTMNIDGTGVTRLTSGLYPTFSPDGKKIAFTSSRSGNSEIYVMNADGTGVTNLTNNSAEDTTPSWSPDGKKIAFASPRTGTWAIFTMNADGTGLTKVSQFSYSELYPQWSPAGDEIAFISTHPRSGDLAVMVQKLDASGRAVVTTMPIMLGPSTVSYPMAWLPDGSKIIYEDATLATSPYKDGVYTVNKDGTNKVAIWQTSIQPTTRPGMTPVYYKLIYSVTCSPDGKKVAFSSLHSGDEEIYVTNIDGTGLLDISNNPAYDGQPSFGPLP